MSDPGIGVAALRRDDAAWDDFVERSSAPAYTQLSGWAEVKAPNGWSSLRVITDAGSGPIGAQVLLRRVGPFAFAYAPRGPVATVYDERSIEAFTDSVRRTARRHRATHVKIDPETDDAAVAAALRDSGWKRAEDVQPVRTRVIDLTRREDELWSDLRSKWRQYVQKARRSGILVVDGATADLDDFYRIYVDTARRAGFFYRTAASYRRVYETFARRNATQLLFAELPSGERVAALMLVSCGGRTIEPYGGMTRVGAETRANYLLKWEAIRRSREAGSRVYDLWGLANEGIEHFKSGFGGREVRYIGAWDLPALPVVREALIAAQRARVALARRRFSTEIRPADAG